MPPLLMEITVEKSRLRFERQVTAKSGHGWNDDFQLI